MPTVPTNTKWDDLDMDIDDTWTSLLPQDEGRHDKVNEKGEKYCSANKVTNMQDEVLTCQTAQTTPTPTPTTFGDDEMIAQVLLNMSQAKAVSKEKEKGLFPRLIKMIKVQKRIEEDEESDTKSVEITEAKKKFDQIAHDEEVARKIQEEWKAKEERKRLTGEEATKTALSNKYDFIQERIKADRLLAERVQEAKREQFTLEERAKFLHDTIATQRKTLVNKELK
ncbi:hypothetical protein Tco_0506756 [Tanacetum coccineum]